MQYPVAIQSYNKDIVADPFFDFKILIIVVFYADFFIFFWWVFLVWIQDFDFRNCDMFIFCWRNGKTKVKGPTRALPDLPCTK